MTTTSARRDASFIDFAAFGLGDEELVSLRSLSDIWGMALREIRPQVANDPVLLDFLELTEELPLALADPAWPAAVTRWSRSCACSSPPSFAANRS